MNPKVAFQGERGAYSEQGCRQFFGDDIELLPRYSFEEGISSTQEGQSDHFVLPVENSLAGTVVPAYDLLVDNDLRVQGEVIVHVQHCLLAPKGTKLADIKRVKSHPQALMQCAHNLRRMGIEPLSHYDTAGSAKDLAENPEEGTAAIASKLAAEIYGLEILNENLQDLPHNFTRMFILGLKDAERSKNAKTSIIFTTRHVPGALYKVIGELVERGINLTKIESRPRRNVPWHYRFYVDFEGHEDDDNVQLAMMGILKKSSFLKVLGSYPAAKLSKR